MNPNEFDAFSSMISNTDKMLNFEDFSDIPSGNINAAVPDVNSKETTPFEAEIDDLLLSAYGTGLMKQRSRERLGIPPPLQHTDSFDSLINVLKSLPDDVDESAEDNHFDDETSQSQQHEPRNQQRQFTRTNRGRNSSSTMPTMTHDLQSFSVPSLENAFSQAGQHTMSSSAASFAAQQSHAMHMPVPPQRHNPPPPHTHRTDTPSYHRVLPSPGPLSMRSMSEPVAYSIPRECARCDTTSYTWCNWTCSGYVL
eukprot:m.853828 g.853828  ORF g.853828 m.853828 type:complete len:254 (-) comp23502_c1_seq35:1667-2428(-)